jgi:UDPglucose--hexose-1-phosphate uridylyltransferase
VSSQVDPAAPDLRRDPLSGRLVVVAPVRAARPGALARAEQRIDPAEAASCPFCAGHEDETPPETLRLPAEGPWQIRVVPNLYPAFAGQEVVVHSPRHLHFLAELDDGVIALIAEAWQARAGAHDGYLHAFVNEHALAGATLPHSHSQLVWLDDPPPEMALELRGERCPLCPPPGGDDLVVAGRDGVSLRAAWAGRAPYELLVHPVEHEGDPWHSPRLVTALRLAVDGLRRLHAVEGLCPMSLWLHASGHWHLEVLPRLTTFGGIELGAGIYVNPLRPEDAAARLREATLYASDSVSASSSGSTGSSSPAT